MSEAGLPPSALTHLAFEVDDVGRSVAFYQAYTGLRVIHERDDEGTKVAWLRDPERGFTLVLVGHPARDRRRCHFAHLGFAVPGRADVDQVAAKARADGVLAFGPEDCGPIVGYVTQVRDPDDNLLEYSHGQQL